MTCLLLALMMFVCTYVRKHHFKINVKLLDMDTVGKVFQNKSIRVLAF